MEAGTWIRAREDRGLTTVSEPSWSGASSVDRAFETAAGCWMVLWTKARQEKAVARYLEAVGLEFFLPLVERVTFIRGRKFRSRVPLFPGYLFLAGEREDGYGAIATKRLCQVIQVPDQVRLVRELTQIRAALCGGATLELHPFAVVGRRCRVIKGPFVGIEGVVTNRLGSSRLVLQVDIICQGASLEIDTDLLEPVD